MVLYNNLTQTACVWSTKEVTMTALIYGGCPFCLENGKVQPFATTSEGYLLTPTNTPIKDTYLLIPRWHAVDPLRFPDDWQQSRAELMKLIPWMGLVSYNVSMNVGIEAGQTVLHLHEWFIPRSGEYSFSAAYRKGLATLIGEANAAARLVRDISEYGLD